MRRFICVHEAREYFKFNKPFYFTSTVEHDDTKSILVDKEYKKENGLKDFDDLFLLAMKTLLLKKGIRGFITFYYDDGKESTSLCQVVQETAEPARKKRGRKKTKR